MFVFISISKGPKLDNPYLHPTVPRIYKRFDVRRSLVSSAAVQLSPVPFSNLSNLRPGAVVICSLTLSIIMFSKAVFTFLAIGALWVNISAIPIPIEVRASPPNPIAVLVNPTPGHVHFVEPLSEPSSVGTGRRPTPSGLRPVPSGYPPIPSKKRPRPVPGLSLQGPGPVPGPSSQGPRPVPGPPSDPFHGFVAGRKTLPPGMYGGEFPRSFSALSYHDLTFVFSVAIGATVLVGTAIGLPIGLLSSHKNKTASKREPMSEDWASDSLSSPLKRESEPAPPSL